MDKKVFSTEKSVVTIAIFIAGLCSIIYELLISTTSSYFLGDSVKQFSLTIGIYMASMGLGAYFSRYFDRELIRTFVWVELILGFIGGLSVPLLYYFFEHLTRLNYIFLMVGLTALIGIMTGLEIPLLIRMMKKHYPLKVNLANVLSLDYFGALIATLLFPFLLLPWFGVFRTGVFFGLVNIMLGLLVWYFFAAQLKLKPSYLISGTGIIIPLGFAGLLWFAQPILERWDNESFTHRVIFSKQTPYQHIILTQNNHDLRLYINRIIQFSSLDEYRYHESLALIPLNVAPYKKQVLVLGGGEGLLVRELLKDEAIEQITVVDLDAQIFDLAKNHHLLHQLNEGALLNPKVKLINDDAAQFLANENSYYDIIISDLPDPSNQEVARLYSTFFYKLVQTRLSKNGIFATQATGTFHTNKAFWCIKETIAASGFDYVYPYHTYVPSFGDWGFILAANQALQPQNWDTDYPTKYLSQDRIPLLFEFEKDIANQDSLRVNKIDQPVLLEYYLADWKKWSKERIK